MRIKRLPPVLQINLNRFGLSADGNAKKINSRCEFEATLDIDAVIRSSESFQLSQKDENDIHVENSNLYHLHAILVHSGSLNSGHYYCFIRPQLDSDQWYKFNDTCVSEISQRHAFNIGMGGYTSAF